MTETLDERIEELRKVVQLVPIGVWNKHVEKALAIIDEMKAENKQLKRDIQYMLEAAWHNAYQELGDKLAESREDMAHAEVERLRGCIDKLKADEKDFIMALEVCGEKIDSYISRRKEDEKLIDRLKVKLAKAEAKDPYLWEGPDEWYE